MVKLTVLMIITFFWLLAFIVIVDMNMKKKIKYRESININIMEHRIFENEKELSNIIKKPIKYLSLFFILTFYSNTYYLFTLLYYNK